MGCENKLKKDGQESIRIDRHVNRKMRRVWHNEVSGVKLEILLVCIGHNLRGYHTRKLEFQNNKLN